MNNEKYKITNPSTNLIYQVLENIPLELGVINGHLTFISRDLIDGHLQAESSVNFVYDKDYSRFLFEDKSSIKYIFKAGKVKRFLFNLDFGEEDYSGTAYNEFKTYFLESLRENYKPEEFKLTLCKREDEFGALLSLMELKFKDKHSLELIVNETIPRLTLKEMERWFESLKLKNAIIK